MIDLHCHILPAVDDGAEDLEASLAMARYALSQGITHILCTPHHNNGRYENDKQSIIEAVFSLQAELDARNIPITLLEGQEVRVTGEIMADLAADKLLFTDIENTYLLLEFPTMDVPAYSEALFFDLRAHGIVPVIVHPERNAKFREDPDLLLPYLEMGCLAQLTAPSIVGIFGKSIQKTAKIMVERNLVQMVASDAHGTNKRTFYLKEAYAAIEKLEGEEKVAQMQQVAKDLVNGDFVNYPSVKLTKKKKFGLF